ncbi:MAG: hypothetical protein R3E89_03205 [Thiolinea sp.]
MHWNRERKRIEADMKADAQVIIQTLVLDQQVNRRRSCACMMPAGMR